MFYGNRGDGQLIKPNEEYLKESNRVATLAENLKEKLKDNKEGLELLDAFFGASSSVEAAAVEQYYRKGFSFGLMMGIEIAGMR